VAGAGKNLATAKSDKDSFGLGIKDALAVEIRTFEVWQRAGGLSMARGEVRQTHPIQAGGRRQHRSVILHPCRNAAQGSRRRLLQEHIAPCKVV